MGSPAVSTVYVELSVVLGSATMPIRHLLKMGRGAVIELDTTTEDSASLYANEKLIARGEIMVVDDHLALNITDMFSADED